MPMLAMPRTMGGAGSSTPSEEGFVSGSSADESSYVDRLAVDFGSFGLVNKTAHTSAFALFGLQQQQKCSSDSGTSSGDIEQSGALLNHDINDRITSEGIMPGAIHHGNDGGSQLPGAWFYEIGSDDTSGSPTGEFHDDFSSLRAALSLNARNVTESVEVPSSEHVAEIVGRQGCKIKALRAKTNTYIKTPVRGDDPIFVVTGRPEDVVDAKREIECAAEHFTQIRASRRHSQGGAPAPGHVTAYVRVPLRVVGLVVGPKGATIKRIQQDTHTYIITPSREREPIFEVTGLPQNVEAARREIEQHIYQRTGNMPITDPTASIGSYDLQGTLASAATMRSSNLSYGALAQPARRQLTLDAFAQGGYISSDFLRSGSDISLGTQALGGIMRTSAFTSYSTAGSPPPSQSSNSSNSSSHMLYNPLELRSLGGGGAASQSLLQQQQRREQQAAGLLLSSSSSVNSCTAAGASVNSNSYPAWSAAYSTLGIGAETQATGTQNRTSSVLSHTTHKNNLFSSQQPLGTLFSGLGSGCGGASAHESPLSLRDEGIAESPSYGLGSFGGDPYHLMMASIWSDLEGPRDQPAGSVDSAAAIATA